MTSFVTRNSANGQPLFVRLSLTFGNFVGNIFSTSIFYMFDCVSVYLIACGTDLGTNVNEIFAYSSQEFHYQ